MERTDTRPPFAASGGIIPPELRKIKTPCYVLDEAALIKNAELYDLQPEKKWGVSVGNSGRQSCKGLSFFG